MLDRGSGVDICPLSTLQRMEIRTGRICPNNIYVRVFDDIKRDTLGEIDMTLTIGPVEFEVTFQGLGKSLQGIVELITLPTSEKFFGVSFRPTPADKKWANDRKNDGWVLPQPVLHLYKTFVKPKYIEEENDEAFTAKKIEEIYGSFVDCYAGYHQVLMDEEDAEKTAFTTPWDEEINTIGVVSEDAHAWKMFFDGAVNAKCVGIGAILISPTGKHYPATAKLRFFCTNNTAKYEA
uniref:Uncharacterized protein LOC104237082 n=1 Tax=Nicotiana sylvestris TaxID=4096 RepID=A0A1U7XBJ4_NICSY|nr:PREDICTED: uncharacterized protein LOC104237082 [Nicotiana sylvestris]